MWGSGNMKFFPYAAPETGQANDLRKLRGDILIENPILGLLSQIFPSLLIHYVINTANDELP